MRIHLEYWTRWYLKGVNLVEQLQHRTVYERLRGLQLASLGKKRLGGDLGT